MLDEYERYAVALVDKRKARLFTVFLGAIEESEAFADFVPGKHDQGGPAQARFQRHHEAHVHWHLKRVVSHLAEMLRRRQLDRLVIKGPEEATSELRGLLPRALAQRLVGVIPAETSAGAAEILEQTLEFERRVEREFEKRLLDDLLEHQGLLASAWGVSENNRRAKYYRLTSAGRRRLSEETAQWNRVVAAMTAALRASAEKA